MKVAVVTIWVATSESFFLHFPLGVSSHAPFWFTLFLLFPTSYFLPEAEQPLFNFQVLWVNEKHLQEIQGRDILSIYGPDPSLWGHIGFHTLLDLSSHFFFYFNFLGI